MENTIGQRIRQLREAKDLSVAALADIAGVKPTAIYGIERGDNKPSFDVLERISEHFRDLNNAWLIRGEGQPFTRTLTPVDERPQPDPPVNHAQMPATIERQNITPGDAPSHLKIVRPTYEELAAENNDLRRKLAAREGELVDWLAGEVKRLRKPTASSDAASLFQTVDDIALGVAAAYVAPGFKQGVHRRLA